MKHRIGIGNFIKSIVFLGLTGLLLFCAQRLLVPKWNYPEFADNDSFTLTTFFAQEKNTDDVLFLGTSHTAYGISPMELYQDKGIVGYNLGTSLQTLAGTYYLIKEALRSQSPQAVVLDVSSAFFDSEHNLDERAFRYLIDSFPYGQNKREFARYYETVTHPEAEPDQQETDSSDSLISLDSLLQSSAKGPADLFPVMLSEGYLGSMYPLIHYHSRWNKLDEIDFRNFIPEDNYQTAGYFLNPTVRSSGQSVSMMNDVEQYFVSQKKSYVTQYESGEASTVEAGDVIYDPRISRENADWLLKINELCAGKGIRLLLIKLPSIRYNNEYYSAWTLKKSELMKSFAAENNLDFLDLLYDADTGIDIQTDFADGGNHLNYHGMQKVTAYLGDYLKDQYHIGSKPCRQYEDNMPVYIRLTRIAQLQMETDFEQYLQTLFERRDELVICIAAENDMISGLDEGDIEKLHQLGLSADFGESPGYRDAYAAIIDEGNVLCETSSNRRIFCDEKIADGKITVSVMSSAYVTGLEASVKVNDTEYAANARGMNMVIIDKATGMVIDNPVFDTSSQEPHSCRRDHPLALLNQYWFESDLGKIG